MGPNSIIVPFLACGDLSGYDADTTYELGSDYVFHDVVSPPINPAYEYAVKLKKEGKLNTELPKVEDLKLSDDKKI